LDKLGGRDTLTSAEANKLIQMLKDEQAEAKRKGQQDAVVAITTLILLVRLLTKKQIPNFG